MKKDNTLKILTHVLGLLTGFIAPLIIYLATKQKDVKEHARKALNWQISYIIYSIISFILIIILIGFLLIGALIIANITFCIIAAIKASENKIYNYPLTINFIK